MSGKPKNFEALMAAWDDPQQWVAEIAEYNKQLREEGAPESELVPLELSRQHSYHLRELLIKQARSGRNPEREP